MIVINKIFAVMAKKKEDFTLAPNNDQTIPVPPASVRSRFDFSARTKSIIAKRAAYRCSFPDCDCTLIGPGNSVDDVIELGECAHIYAAGEDGPRKSTLSEDTIKSAFNGIYLCRKHHKIIDRNKDKYPAELLLQYKTRHEFLISQEIGDYAYPSFWINRIEIEPNDILRNGFKFDLAKVNLIFGDNGTGKSTIVELLYEAFTRDILERWKDKNFMLHIDFSNTVFGKITVNIQGNHIVYIGDNQKERLASIPYIIRTIFFHEDDLNGSRYMGMDDMREISQYFNIDVPLLEDIINTTSYNNALFIKALRIKRVRSNPYVVNNLMVVRKDDVKNELWSFNQLSGGEQKMVVFDIIISYLMKVSKYVPTLFLVDTRFIYGLDVCVIKEYLELLQSAEAHFQTIMVSHTKWKDIDWEGWEIMDLPK